MRTLLSICCFVLWFAVVIGLIVAQDKAPSAPPPGDKKTEASKATDLTDKQKAEMAGLLIDLQNAQLAKVNLEKAIEKAKAEADKTIEAASAAYVKRLDELRKEHHADGKNLDLRQQWQETPKQP